MRLAPPSRKKEKETVADEKGKNNEKSHRGNNNVNPLSKEWKLPKTMFKDTQQI